MVIFCSFHNFELKKQKVILKQIYFRRRVEIFKTTTKSRKSLKEAKKDRQKAKSQFHNRHCQADRLKSDRNCQESKYKI